MEKNFSEKLKNLDQEIKSHLKHPYENFKLVIVTKKQDNKEISEIIKLGYRIFAENYVDESLSKIEYFKKKNLEWHFIGRIQSNKIKKICKYFDWVQTICSEKHAVILDNECQKINKNMNICIQINIDNEESKSGIQINELNSFIKNISKLKNLTIRGLMAIPSKTNILKEKQDSYTILRLAFEKLTAEMKNFDTLSIGMSNDYICALQNGSTMLRIGQYIFGERK